MKDILRAVSWKTMSDLCQADTGHTSLVYTLWQVLACIITVPSKHPFQIPIWPQNCTKPRENPSWKSCGLRIGSWQTYMCPSLAHVSPLLYNGAGERSSLLLFPLPSPLLNNQQGGSKRSGDDSAKKLLINSEWETGVQIQKHARKDQTIRGDMAVLSQNTWGVPTSTTTGLRKPEATLSKPTWFFWIDQSQGISCILQWEEGNAGRENMADGNSPLACRLQEKLEFP